MSNNKKKSKILAYVLAIFFGGVGFHHFYLRNFKRGLLYLLFSWTFVPILLGWIDVIAIKKCFESTQCNEPSDKLILNNNNITYYNSDIHILPEYEHLKTPQYILDNIALISSGMKKSIDSDYGITISISTNEDRFMEQSLRNSNVNGEKCDYIPFKEYYPQYSDMNVRQKEWYFYWRSLVLDKKYINTDVSYIYLFIYELLNFSFNQSAAFNISMLKTLSKQYSAVEHYAEMWLADLICEIDTEKKDYADDNIEKNNSLYNKIIKNNEDYSSLSISLWKPYLRNTRETVFFSNYKSTIYKVFKHGLNELENYYRERGFSLIDQWFQEKKESRTRYLYSGALVGREKIEGYSYDIKVRNLKANFKEELTALYRMSENITRDLFNEKRKIKVDLEVLPDNFEEKFRKEINRIYEVNDSCERFKLVKSKQSIIQEYKIPKPIEEENKITENFTMKFDKVEIDKLNKKSMQLVETFENYDEEDNEKKSSQLDVKNINDIFHNNGSDDNAIDSILTNVELEYLKIFNDYKIPILQSNEFFLSNGLMAGAFISSLNEKIYNYIDDVLIRLSSEYYEIDEDYKDFFNSISKE